MFGGISSQTKIFLVLGRTDMRKSIDTLGLIVSGHVGLDLLSGSLFVFCNASHTIIKILYWDRSGFCLWQKRLERHRFRWPQHAEEVYAIQGQQLAYLLDGLDLTQLHPHKELIFTDTV